MLSQLRAAFVCMLLLAATTAWAQVSEPVGMGSPTQSVSLTFSSSGTLGSVAVLTQGAPNLDFNLRAGGSCVDGTAYTAGQTCTVEYSFTPSHPGVRYGGITLTTGSGTLLASKNIYGSGIGPQVAYSPASQITLGSGFIKPAGLAVDGLGNVFVADAGNPVKEILVSGGYTTVNIISSAFSDPVAVALDGAGNLFVADYEANTITEIVAAGGYTASIPIAASNGNFNEPTGIAIDGNGNLFVADYNNNKVKEILALGGYTTVSTLAGGFDGPIGIAVDAAGNVFVLNVYNGLLQELPVSTGYAAATTIASGFTFADGLSIDGLGNLLIADENMSVKEVLAAGGYATVKTLASNLACPDAVTVDGNGNFFVAQHCTPAVFKFDVGDAPSLTFAATPLGKTSSDSPQTVTIVNNGNATLVYSPAGPEASPNITAGFTFTSPCPTAAASTSQTGDIAPGSSCAESISFTPVSPGNNSGAFTLIDNNLNGNVSQQVIFLSGTATVSAQPTVTSVSPPTGPAGGGTTVTITGTNFTGTTAVNFGAIATTSFTVNSATSITAISPAGTNTVDVTVTTAGGTSASSPADLFTYAAPLSQTIQFTQPASAYAGTSVLLTAIGGASGNPVTFSVVSGPATVNGPNGSVLTYTGAGTIVVEADQAGNSAFSAAAPVQVTASATLLTESIATTSPAVPTLVIFTATGTLSNIQVLMQGAANLDFAAAPATPTVQTCNVGTTYAAGQICQISFTFTPTLPGIRFGGIILSTASGALLGNSYVYGIGSGPHIVYTPGTQVLRGAGLGAPSGVSVDGSGNIYVSDLGNFTVEEIPANGGATSVLGTFVDTPDDVTVDGSGNVFVACRTTVYEIVAVNGSIPVSPVINTIATGFVTLDGIKVDGNGNVFLAEGDTLTSSGGLGNGVVYELVAVNGILPASPKQLTLGSGLFTAPTGVAFDASGDIFVSDQSVPSAIELVAVNGVIPSSPTERLLGSGFASPSNIALDSRGDVFVTDAGNSTVYEMLAVNGVVPTSATPIQVVTGLSSPQGMIVDANGNIFVADESKTQIVESDFSVPPSLTFADTAVNSTSTDSPKTVTITNDGNASLLFTLPGSGPNPTITAGFNLGATSTCPQLTASSAAATLAEGASCTDVVSFTPVAVGPDSGKLITTDNDGNVPNATQTILLNGNGLPLTTTIVFTVADQVYGNPPFAVTATSNSPGAITYSVVSGPATIAGNIVMLTGAGVVVLEASQAASGIYAAGSAMATFNVAKEPQTINFTPPASPVLLNASPIPLIATASSGLPVSFSVLSGPATVSGNMLTLTGGCATVVVAADQAGNANYSAAPEVTQSITVGSCMATVALTASPNPVFLLNPVGLTATLTFAAGVPTGTVQFFDGSNLLGTAGLSGSVATIAVSTLSFGAHNISAVYSGDNRFPSATSPIVIEFVQDFSLTITNPVLTIQHGGTATYTLVLTSVGGAGMAATISLGVAGSPDNSVISFTPASVATGSGTTSVAMVIQTPDYPVGPWGEASMGIFAAAGLLLMLRRKHRLFGVRMGRLGCLAFVLAASSALATLSGCGSGWGPQHFALTVTASSGALSHTATARLTSE